ncbi:hypothetical protein, partial [Klenkia sp. PcliD-1-E]|uniref:hypothetical protein n=1 Tax=Klenkia sp. PcliD-1-E TaxID=2954492 RepID=UPI00209748F4
VAGEEGVRPDPGTAHLYVAATLPRRPPPRCAVWLGRGDGLPDVPATRAHVVPVVELPTAGLPSGTAAPVLLAPDTRPHPHRRVVLPFTRRRWRGLRGLPDGLVVSVTDDVARWGPSPAQRAERAAPEGSLDTLYALAAAAVVTGPAVLDAVRWGCPVVTDPATAAALSVRADEHVLVATGQDVVPALQRLVEDEATGALLARAAVRAVADRRPDAAAAHLATALGFDVAAPAGPAAAALVDALDALGAPAGAHIRARAQEFTAALPGATTFGWRPDEEDQ